VPRKLSRSEGCRDQLAEIEASLPCRSDLQRAWLAWRDWLICGLRAGLLPVGDRLDITGARWGLQGAEAILTLRAVIANGDYDDYWRYHLACEHQRLYPSTAQGEHTLTA
jgi:hypothetical protein